MPPSIVERPWISQYPSGVPAHLEPVEPLSMPALLDRAAADFGDRLALSCGDDCWTYAEMRMHVGRVAAGLRALGIRQGDRIAVLMPNHPAVPIWFFAGLSLGAIVVSLNPLYARPALEHMLTDSGARILLTLDSDELRYKAAKLRAGSALEHIVVAAPDGADLTEVPAQRSKLDDGFTSLSSLLENDWECVTPDIDAAETIAVLQYTGGTTGTPKGAMLTHANLSINAGQIRSWLPSLQPGAERIMIPLPLSHITGITVSMTLAVSLAAELIVVPRFVPADSLKVLLEKKPTVFGGVPTVFTALLQVPEMNMDHWRSVNTVLCGGAPLPPDIRRGFKARSGCTVRQLYGATEMSPVASIMPAVADEPENAVGLPVTGTVVEIRSVGDPAQRMPANTSGEIVVRGPQVMKGYWHRPEETKASFIDGFFRTGDIGLLDERGYLHIVDRLKDMIIVSGYNVYPANVENAIYAHPAVAEAIVIGASDNYRGEIPKAYVVLRPGTTLSLDELQTFLTDRLSPIEMPRQLEVRSELPKTAVGKLSRLELRRSEQG